MLEIKEIAIILNNIFHRVNIVAISVTLAMTTMIKRKHFNSFFSQRFGNSRISSRVFTDTMAE